MNNIIENFIINMKRDDIVKFAKKNNLTATDNEIDFVYSFIKNNYKEVLNDPNRFDITLYKNNLSSDNYNFINNLINKYKKMIL